MWQSIGHSVLELSPVSFLNLYVKGLIFCCPQSFTRRLFCGHSVITAMQHQNTCKAFVWGPVPLSVRSALVDLIYLALLKQALVVCSGGEAAVQHAATLESLAHHQNLPALPAGKRVSIHVKTFTMTYDHNLLDK